MVQTQDLFEFIEKKSISCLNSRDPASNVFTGSGVKSDCDEQLLISCSFNTPVTIVEFTISETDEDHAPRTIKIFGNALNMDFDDVDSELPTITKELAANSNTISVPPTKFNRVSSLAIFIEDNQGDEEVTHLAKITLKGWPLSSTEMKNLKKAQQYWGNILSKDEAEALKR